MISIAFLGTSFAIPTKGRNHTAMFLSYKGENILVDCGEGTQRQFRKAGLNPCKITKILLTHRHADHSLGLPGLLKTLDISGYTRTLEIYGPRGTKKFIENVLIAFGKIDNYKLEVKEVEGKFFDNEDFSLEAKSMTHGVPCNAYNFVKKGQVRIDKKKLAKLKNVSVENLKKLKQGKDIVHEGRKRSAKTLTYKEEDKKISFILDTSMNAKIVPFAKNSDVLVCEATFHSDLKNEAKQKGHLTAEEAGEIAKKSKSKKLLLTHISQRYETSLKELLQDAKRKFKNTEIANDFDRVELK